MIDKDKALDLLRELNTIGTGRVATALSEILEARVELTFPEAEFISFKNLVQKLNLGKTFFIIETNLEGDIMGRMTFLLHIQDAKVLGSGLLKKKPDDIDTGDQLFQSSLRETVNIFAGSYTEVITEMTHLNIYYNVPFLNLGSTEIYLASIPEQFYLPELMFFISTIIKVENISFRGALLFLLDYNSIKRLFETLGESELVMWIEMMKLKINKDKDTPGDMPNIKYLS
jgi:chemotaxis protein CheC